MIIDEKDFKIIELLKQNSKLTTQQISKKTLIPITTIHNRIKKLEKEGIIKNYTLELDHKKLGKSISAYILMEVNYTELKNKGVEQEDLAKKIGSHELTENISLITGDYDLIAKVLAKDVSQLDEFVTKFLRKVDGIKKTQTMIILHDSK